MESIVNENLTESDASSGPSSELTNHVRTEAKMFCPFLRVTGGSLKKIFLNRVNHEKMMPPKKRLYPFEDFESIEEEAKKKLAEDLNSGKQPFKPSYERPMTRSHTRRPASDSDNKENQIQNQRKKPARRSSAGKTPKQPARPSSREGKVTSPSAVELTSEEPSSKFVAVPAPESKTGKETTPVRRPASTRATKGKKATAEQTQPIDLSVTKKKTPARRAKGKKRTALDAGLDAPVQAVESASIPPPTVIVLPESMPVAAEKPTPAENTIVNNHEATDTEKLLTQNMMDELQRGHKSVIVFNTNFDREEARAKNIGIYDTPIFVN